MFNEMNNMKIPKWTEEEAKENIERIVNNRGLNEGFDIDWKSELYFGNTGNNKKNNSYNTTQKAMSGFANTYGGYLVVGITNNREIIGYEKSDIDNYIKNNCKSKLNHIPAFEYQNYKYNEKNILVLFIQQSKIPIRCDNGAYYYREKSEFEPMTHAMLEYKFRKNFDDEKYYDLTLQDLKNTYFLLENIQSENKLQIPIKHSLKYFLESDDKLYFYYKDNNLFNDYNKLKKEFLIDICKESDWEVDNLTLNERKKQIKEFIEKLEKHKINE